MPNRLADAVSPYLRSHADNPVDWFEWGAEPFAVAAERDVPVLVSIGYSTCHWCHVMARESFGDPALAAVLNEGFVAVKVDREEYPDVDASYLAAAGAFTDRLGWPLNVFVTPSGRAFFAGTYWPPGAVGSHPAFRTVLDAVGEAWRERRGEVESTSTAIAEALGASGSRTPGTLPGDVGFSRIVTGLAAHEDTTFGGFGGAPKFPVGTVLRFLLDRGALGGEEPHRGGADAAALAARTLSALAASPLRDPVEGGFFRYATRRDWSEPHYERMLYDNALLLECFSRSEGGTDTAEGIVTFLRDVLRVDSGAFGSAQDSESTVDGERVEGGYYALDAGARAAQHPPAVDRKVLTGWNGLAIGALADAGARHARADWIDLARGAARMLVDTHLRHDGSLVRASIDGRLSGAAATLEDYGMLAGGLLSLARATGEAEWAVVARGLVDACLVGGGVDDVAGDTVDHIDAATTVRVPGGPDAVLAAQGLALDVDPSEGAYPSGVSAFAAAALDLHALTALPRYRSVAMGLMESVATLAVERPIAFGASLSVMTALAAGSSQLVVVAASSTDPLVDVARSVDRPGLTVAVVTPEQALALASAGFALFEGRRSQGGLATAYLCRDFVCRLPVTDAAELRSSLSEHYPLRLE
jgi:uncharacterized protein YyaL (SSP411 family)